MKLNIKDRKYIQLPVDFLQSEKGNTLLTGDDGKLVAWVELSKDYYLEVEYTPDNSPSFYVSVRRSTPENLRQHVVENLEGWHVDRWNLPGDPPVDKDGDVEWGVK